jgi:hypothetical protein
VHFGFRVWHVLETQKLFPSRQTFLGCASDSKREIRRDHSILGKQHLVVGRLRRKR